MKLRKIGRSLLVVIVTAMATVATAPPAGAAEPPPNAILIVGLQSNKCVDVPGPTKANVQIDIYTCYKTSNNLWWYQDFKDQGFRQLRNHYSGKCLTVLNASLENNAPVIQYECPGNGDNSEWRPYLLIDGSLDWYAWQNRRSQKCLTVQNASTANNAKLIQYSCEGAKFNWYWTWMHPSAY